MVIKKRLCSHCKTGLKAYQKDNRAPMCPYIQHHDGRDCRFYVPISQSRFLCWLEKFKQRKKQNVSNTVGKSEH